MLYDNSQVRRQDHLLDEKRALSLLEEGEYGFLAMATCEGGYGVPINFVYQEGVVYLHCATEGRKLCAIKSDSRVTFCVVGATRLIAEQFTTAYQSVMLYGRARIVESDDERRKALMFLVKKYSAQYLDMAERAIEGSLPRTAVIAIDVERISGKAK